METVGKFVVYMLLVAGGIILHAFVFVKLWEWIISPIFHVANLNIYEAFALSVIIGFVTPTGDAGKKESDIPNTIITSVVKVCFYLLLGWICTFFIHA